MLNFLKKKIEQTNSIDEFDSDEKKFLIASILIECAKEDGEISNEETDQIKLVLSQKLELSEEKINEIVSEAIEKSEDRIELYSITKNIRDTFSQEEIFDLFVNMWQIILVDDIIDDFEANLMTRLVGLFHLTGRESSEAKEIARKNLNN